MNFELDKITKAIAVATASSFVLGVSHEIGFSSVFGLFFWGQLSFSDFASLTVHWLPIVGFAFCIIFLFSAAVSEPATHVARLSSQFMFLSEEDSKKISRRPWWHLDNLLGYSVALVVLTLPIGLLTLFVYWVRALFWVDGDLAIYGNLPFLFGMLFCAVFILSLFTIVVVWDSKGRYAFVATSLACNCCALAVWFGAVQGNDIVSSRDGFVKVSSDEVSAKCVYKIVQTTDKDLVLLSAPWCSEESNSSHRTVYVVRRELIRSISQYVSSYDLP